MSFFTCNRTGNCPGAVSGSSLSGICEKACIQVDKVLDAAMRRIQQNNVQVSLTNQNPHRIFCEGFLLCFYILRKAVQPV